MTTQSERADLFRALHVKGDPLILFNIWDAGSAKAIEESGAKAIATSSWSVAAANGFEDGENLPFDFLLPNIERIVSSVNLPVTIDLESGYARDNSELKANIKKVIAATAVGINFEDRVIGSETLYTIEEQCRRIKAIREVAEQAAIPLFINARTDVFLNTYPDKHDEALLDEVICRATAYAQAGANGLFAPGLRNAQFIKKLCDVSPIAVNIMVLPDTPPPRELAKLGVARISYGPVPYNQMREFLKEAGRKACVL